MAYSSPYPHRLAPIEIGGLRLRNRLLMGSMHTGLEEAPDGARRLAAFYAERARGGVGLIVTGGWSPNAEGRHWDGMSSFDSEEQAREHRPITAAVHAEGAAIALQLLHCGRYAHHAHGVAPSALRHRLRRHVLDDTGSSTRVERALAEHLPESAGASAHPG